MLMIHLPLVWLSRDQIEKSLKAESNLEPLREEKNNMLGKSTWLVMCTAVLATAVTSKPRRRPQRGGLCEKRFAEAPTGRFVSRDKKHVA